VSLQLAAAAAVLKTEPQQGAMVAQVVAVRTPAVLSGQALLGRAIMVVSALRFPVMVAAVAALVLLGPITLIHLLLVVLVWRHQSPEHQSLALVGAVAVA
jgi:hypothetical protein